MSSLNTRKDNFPFRICDSVLFGSVDIGSFLKSDGVPTQYHWYVLMNYNNFPKWCIFTKTSVMQEIEILWNKFQILWCVSCDIPFWLHEKGGMFMLLLEV